MLNEKPKPSSEGQRDSKGSEGCCLSQEKSRARFFATLRSAQNDRLWRFPLRMTNNPYQTSESRARFFATHRFAQNDTRRGYPLRMTGGVAFSSTSGPRLSPGEIMGPFPKAYLAIQPPSTVRMEPWT
jgi:ribosome modulation factor